MFSCFIFLNYTRSIITWGKSIRYGGIFYSLSTVDNNHKIKTGNPAKEEILNEYESINKDQLNDLVKKNQELYFLEWKKDPDKHAYFLCFC